jgi:hypothetical protein
VNGSNFKTIGNLPAKGIRTYNFTDDNGEGMNFDYRLRYVYPNERFGVSGSIRISKSVIKQPSAFYKEGEGAKLKIYCDKNEKARIAIFSSGGSLVYSSQYNLTEGCNEVLIKDALKWDSGMYFIDITTSNSTIARFVK